jgi:lysophospholipase L1-like esterase
MRPYQILAFFISVVLVLLILSLVFPPEGVKINDNITLKFITIDELFEEDTVIYADISSIIENSGIENEMNDPTITEVFVQEDTIVPIDTIRANADSLKKITHLIEFPAGGEDLFYNFFSEVSRLNSTGKLMRILHYGDSQIESDRITGYIRNKMQLSFGGSGCGLVPAVPLYNGKMSVKQTSSPGWKRKTGFINRDTTINHMRYGALFGFSSINYEKKDPEHYEWLQFQPSPISYSTARRFNNISIILGKQENSIFRLKLFLNDSLIDEISTDLAFEYNRLNWKLDESPENVRFEMNPDESIMVYGVSLDNSWGIAVDNIPLRGSAGLVFSRTDTSFLRQMYDDMNVGLLILQFGGNVVPYMKNSRQYERFFKRELRVIKSIVPGVPVLVVGPSDMSIRENGRYVTNPNLEKVRDALKTATLSAGFAFWDMYEAMGGRNSMPSWVFADPPLAVSDFVHFNTRGARLIGEMLYNSIIYEYDIWREKTSSKIVMTAEQNSEQSN